MKNIEVTLAQRLDQAVVAYMPQLSRSLASRLIESGKVHINGRVVLKAGYKLHMGDTIRIDYDERELKQTQKIDIPVIYEDNDCVLINKPIGLLTHSKGAFNSEPTVATWLKGRLSENLGDDRGGIVHRLDRATSGVMICAKTLESQRWLQKQFSQRKVVKTYDAIVPGQMPYNHAIIDMPIIRNPKKPQLFHVSSKGKPATTEYWVQEQGPSTTLLKLQPKTGRTHQIRVHLSTIGHPIIGDTFYGGVPAERLYLHARELELVLPNRVRKSFSAPLPVVFQEQLKV